MFGRQKKSFPGKDYFNFDEKSGGEGGGIRAVRERGAREEGRERAGEGAGRRGRRPLREGRGRLIAAPTGDGGTLGDHISQPFG